MCDSTIPYIELKLARFKENKRFKPYCYAARRSNRHSNLGIDPAAQDRNALTKHPIRQKNGSRP